MIAVRPPAEASDITIETIADVRIRNRRAIEKTRASLDQLRLQKSRMSDALSSMRIQVQLARTLRSGGGLDLTSKRPLSHGEIRVLKGVAAGLPNKQVAIRLQISERTVRNHMTGIFVKLQVHSRTEAVLKALRLGLLTI